MAVSDAGAGATRVSATNLRDSPWRSQYIMTMNRNADVTAVEMQDAEGLANLELYSRHENVGKPGGEGPSGKFLGEAGDEKKKRSRWGAGRLARRPPLPHRAPATPRRSRQRTEQGSEGNSSTRPAKGRPNMNIPGR